MATIRSRDAALFIELLRSMLVVYVAQLSTSQIRETMDALHAEMARRERDTAERRRGTQDDT